MRLTATVFVAQVSGRLRAFSALMFQHRPNDVTDGPTVENLNPPKGGCLVIGD